MTLESVEAAVAQLPLTYRQIVIWRNKEGMSFEEMAKQLHLPLMETKRMWAKAIRALQRKIDENTVSEETC